MVLFLIFLTTIFGGNTSPDTWQCRNDIEIRCDGKHCRSEKQGEFTPMSVNFDDAGALSVCAYSGCWEGTSKVFRNGDFLVLTGQDLKFSTSPDVADSRQSILIALDKSNNIATLKAGEFAHPLVCTQRGG